MIQDKERLLAAIEHGVNFSPQESLEKFIRLSWLIARADDERELRGYADALDAVMQHGRVFH